MSLYKSRWSAYNDMVFELKATEDIYVDYNQQWAYRTEPWGGSELDPATPTEAAGKYTDIYWLRLWDVEAETAILCGRYEKPFEGFNAPFQLSRSVSCELQRVT